MKKLVFKIGNGKNAHGAGSSVVEGIGIGSIYSSSKSSPMISHKNPLSR